MIQMKKCFYVVYPIEEVAQRLSIEFNKKFD